MMYKCGIERVRWSETWIDVTALHLWFGHTSVPIKCIRRTSSK